MHVTFDELTSGDRFWAVGSLWTKLTGSTARRHGQESIAKGEEGYGYVGDAICSFEAKDTVEFCPVTFITGG